MFKKANRAKKLKWLAIKGKNLKLRAMQPWTSYLETRVASSSC